MFFEDLTCLVPPAFEMFRNVTGMEALVDTPDRVILVGVDALFQWVWEPTKHAYCLLVDPIA